MNLILLFKEDFIAPQRVRLSGDRKDHIQSILKAKAGDALCVGLCDGLIGRGTVVENETEVVLEVNFDQSPPDPLPLTLILALPRPPVLKRVLLCAASLGIKNMIILNFNRVEKSLWNSSALKTAAIQEQLVLGLQQAKDTRMPEVILEERFKPFVEDRLPGLIKGTLGLVAHPAGNGPCPHNIKGPVTLIIGPEGGIIDYELEKLVQLGFKPVDLGPRILKVESVLPYMIGRIGLAF
ncbi:MAG: 16S rRNA (uracil(1498)-N(3))-methyltransferase [Candidatus Omnitrophica bacterium]|nr:16S rRNA (uracil(1498)-N(3))-methyltransferase [Candidatus Omnitrophota bacterium]